MPTRLTNYDIANILKSRGFSMTSTPFETALKGNTILILAPTTASAAMCQRSFYARLANTKIDFVAKKLKFVFPNNGGRLEIYTPSVNATIFDGLDKKTTFYSIYRD